MDIYIYYVYIYFDKGKFELIKEIFSVAKSWIEIQSK